MTFERSVSHGEVRRGSDRSFGVLVGGVLLLFALYPVIGGQSARFVLLLPSIALIAAALVRPAVLSPLNAAWTRVGEALGRVVPPIALGLLFFLVVTPVGLLRRFFGGDPLRLRYDPSADSYWIRRDPPGPPGESLANQF